jgi:hypothetical protein
MDPVSKELLKLADKLSNGIFGDLKNGLLGDPSSSPMAAAADRLRRPIEIFYLLAQNLVFCKLRSRQIAYRDTYD